jgi:hypothetical protein
MSHIKAIFLPPNVTSKVQPLNQGDIVSFKAHYCRQLVQWLLEEANKGENEGKTLKSLAPSFYQKMPWTQMVTAETIQNCSGKSGLLKSRNNEPAGASSGSEVGEAQVHMVDPDESQDSVISDSAQYLSRLKAVTNHNGMLATNDELMDAHDFVILHGEEKSFEGLSDQEIIDMVASAIAESPLQDSDEEENDGVLPCSVRTAHALTRACALEELALHHPELGADKLHAITLLRRKSQCLSLSGEKQSAIDASFGGMASGGQQNAC